MKIQKLIVSVMLCLALCSCSQKTATSDSEHLLKGYIALCEAEEMVNRIYRCIDNLKAYKCALLSGLDDEIEYYSSLCSDIYGCGMHLYIHELGEPETYISYDLMNLCKIISCNYEDVVSYMHYMDDEIRVVTQTYEHLHNYQMTGHSYFIEQYDKYMQNIEMRKNDTDYYKYCIKLSELKYLTNKYLEGDDIENNELIIK